MLREETQDPAAAAAYWRAEAQRLAARVTELEEENAQLRAQVAVLTEQIATLTKMIFGKSSERSHPDPIESPEANSTSSSDSGGDAAPKRGQRHGSKGHGRRDYSHLETEEIIHDVDESAKICGLCGTAYSPFGEETCEQIDWVVKISRIIHIRRKYRRDCRCNVPGVVVGSVVPKPIAKGRFTSRFLARLLIEKFCFATPVNRVVAALGLVGAEFSTGSLTGSLKAVSALLEPLDAAIRARNAQAGHLHVDETSWSVFEAVEGKANNRWWLWVFVGSDTTVFRIEQARSTKALTEHLGIVGGKLPEGREVLVSSDFYAVYQSLSQNVEGFDSLWCWAHIRRYFIRAGDAHNELRAWRDEWVLRIGALYGAHRAVGQTLPETPEHQRAIASFDAALRIIDTTRKEQKADPGLHNAAAKVLATLDHEWDGLVAHRDHIELPLDNNTSERALRGPVVGRKNYNGSGAVWAAKLASQSWTIIGTAQRAGLNPFTYLSAYLDACGKNGSKALEGDALAPFLPWAASEQDLEMWRGPGP